VAAGATEAVGQGKDSESGPFLAGNSQSASGQTGGAEIQRFFLAKPGEVTAFLNSVRSSLERRRQWWSHSRLA